SRSDRMPTSLDPSITSTAPMPLAAISRIASMTGASGATANRSGALASSSCRTVRMVLPSRWLRCVRAYSGGRGMPVIEQVQRALLGFLVQAPEVFADQAQRDQLHAAEEQDHRHHRRPTGNRIAVEQRLGHDHERIEEGQ